MTAQEAIAYMETDHWSVTRPGLERVSELLEKLGNPQEKLKCVHVAGSNGKGSCAAMMESILRSAGYHTGLFTSPALLCWQDQIRMDGKNITDWELSVLTEEIRAACEGMADHPSRFEMLTALALLCFARRELDVCVIEVGMGGLNDATNVIPAPEAAIIMNIGLEHTEWLGDTVEKIAAVKAGIIKPGCDAVCYRNTEGVEQVFAQVCAEKNVPLTMPDFNAIAALESNVTGQSFEYKDFGVLRLPLLGDHQLKNAAVVLEAVDVLRRRGWNISNVAVRMGLAGTGWPARFEILRRDPLFILDGGHNPQCADAVADTLNQLCPGQKFTFLLGVLSDKDYESELDLFLPMADHFLCVTPDSPRALPAPVLAERIRARGVDAVALDTIEAGTDAAYAVRGPVLAVGSLYMAGDVRKRFLQLCDFQQKF